MLLTMMKVTHRSCLQKRLAKSLFVGSCPTINIFLTTREIVANMRQQF